MYHITTENDTTFFQLNNDILAYVSQEQDNSRRSQFYFEQDGIKQYFHVISSGFYPEHCLTDEQRLAYINEWLSNFNHPFEEAMLEDSPASDYWWGHDNLIPHVNDEVIEHVLLSSGYVVDTEQESLMQILFSQMRGDKLDKKRYKHSNGTKLIVSNSHVAISNDNHSSDIKAICVTPTILDVLKHIGEWSNFNEMRWRRLTNYLKFIDSLWTSYQPDVTDEQRLNLFSEDFIFDAVKLTVHLVLGGKVVITHDFLSEFIEWDVVKRKFGVVTNYGVQLIMGEIYIKRDKTLLSYTDKIMPFLACIMMASDL